jgi:hypothetical protein
VGRNGKSHTDVILRHAFLKADTLFAQQREPSISFIAFAPNYHVDERYLVLRVSTLTAC